MAACGIALSGMVANLSSHKRGWDDRWSYFSDIAEKAEGIRKSLIAAVDADTEAFNRVMDAFSLPKSTDEEKEIRSAAIQLAQKGAVDVPLQVMRTSLSAMPLTLTMATEGNPNSVSDAGVGAAALHAGIYGAYLNVLINLKDLKDRSLAAAYASEAEKLLSESAEWENKIKDSVLRKISS
jgi:glutamate formiminotransferase/formiminotetrahydrofolate cyclodeaminase